MIGEYSDGHFFHRHAHRSFRCVRVGRKLDPEPGDGLEAVFSVPRTLWPWSSLVGLRLRGLRRPVRLATGAFALAVWLRASARSRCAVGVAVRFRFAEVVCTLE